MGRAGREGKRELERAGLEDWAKRVLFFFFFQTDSNKIKSNSNSRNLNSN
jgi:hypothetical protein